MVEAKSLTWRYYQAHPKAGLWNAPDAILPILQERLSFNGRRRGAFVAGASSILRYGAWQTSCGLRRRQASDHADKTNGSGPSWVASVVNAIGESPYWDNTAIFVRWDDWGGWYDHVEPPVYNSYELGFRVPLIVISPYAKTGYVSHDQHEFGSILKFTEKAFGLGSLGTTDVRADDLVRLLQLLSAGAHVRADSDRPRSAITFCANRSRTRPGRRLLERRVAIDLGPRGKRDVP